MNEPTTQNAGAESSPVTTFEVPDGPAYHEWRKTGALPSAESAPATTKKSSDSEPVEGEGEGGEASRKAPESETGNNSGKKQPSKAERRLNELLEDMREAGLSPAELKSFKAQYQKKVESSEPADKKPAAEPTEKPQGLKAPVKPKESDFKTYEEYEAAKDQYLEDMADYKAAKRFEDYQAKQREEATQKEMRERLEAAKERYGDDAADETIVSAAKGIFNGDAVPAVIKEVLNESSVLVDVLYALGKDAEQLAEFISLAKSNPGAAMRKAILVEKFVMEELEKGGSGKRVTTESEPADKGASPERDSTGKFIKQATPEKKTTSAPPPPKTVSGRSSAPPDEVQDAVSAGDFNTYRDAANRKDLNRRLGK